jgi:sugar lactone lactonase YvrE
MREPQVLLTGLAFGESPRWHDGRLWLSDWGAYEALAVDPAGKAEVVAKLPSFPSCIDFLRDGRLIVVSAHDRRLLRREADGSLAMYADLSGLADHPWNEVVVDSRDNAYVNNIGFDFPDGEPAPGTIALVAPDGSPRPVASDLWFPNGMAVTPDNATLIVAESYANRLTAFDIADDGSLSNRRSWADLGDGVPDGICLDAEGAIWYGDVPNMRAVRVREGGAVLDTIELDRGCFACALGGTDGRTLFLVATDWNAVSDDTTGGARTGQVLTVEAPAPGAAWA